MITKIRLIVFLLAFVPLSALADKSFRVAGVDFNNFDYPATPGYGAAGPYAVRKGEFESHRTEVTMLVQPDDISTGEMRGDGSRQAAVLLTTSAPVGSTSTLYLFDVRESKATLLAHFDAFGSAEGCLGIRFRIEKRFLYVEVPSESPGMSEVTTYALRGSRLAKVYALKHNRPCGYGR